MFQFNLSGCVSPARVGLGWLVVLCLPLAAIAAEQGGASYAVMSPLALKRMSVEDLLQQQVTSVSRQPEAWGQTASDVFVITGRVTPATGATTLPQVLRLAPNLFVAQTSSSQWAVNARGFVRSSGLSNKLLVMIDGRTVYSPIFSNVYWDATSVFLPDLQQVEAISGPAGSTWGANAVNGVINIQTKSAKETLGGLVFANAGTQETDGGVRYGVKLGQQGALRVYFQRSKTESSLSATGVDDNADSWQSTQGGFRADWSGSNTAEVTVSGDVFAGHYHNDALPDTVNNGANLLARWSRDLSAHSSLWVRLYHDYSNRDTQSAITETTHTTDLEFQHHLRFTDGQDFLWGSDYRLMADDITHAPGFVVLPPKLQWSLASVFAQHQVSFLNEALRATTGLRLEHNHFSGWEYQPSFRLAWLRSKETVWLGASRATRIPSRLETGYFQPETPPYIVVGGANVRSETMQAYELGWRSQPAKNFSFTATLFFNDYNHLRSVEPGPPVTFDNDVKGESYGLELFADWDVNAWWRMRIGGFRTDQDTWLQDGGADVENARGESSFPKYQVQFRNTFRPTQSVSIWTALRRVDNVPTYENRVAGTVPAYTELDLSVVWTPRPEIEVGLTGRNLLDRSHPEMGSLAVRREIQRSVQAEVRFHF